MLPLMNMTPSHLLADCLDNKLLDNATKDKVAVVFVPPQAGGRNLLRLTYGNLDLLANKCAHIFYKYCLKPDDKIILALENSVELLIAFLGALKLGCLPILASPHLSGTEWQNLIHQTSAKIIITNINEFSRQHHTYKKPSIRDIFVCCQKEEEIPLGTQRFQNLLSVANTKRQNQNTYFDTPYGMSLFGENGQCDITYKEAHTIYHYRPYETDDIILTTSKICEQTGLIANLIPSLLAGSTMVFFNHEPTDLEVFEIISQNKPNILALSKSCYSRMTALFTKHTLSLNDHKTYFLEDIVLQNL